MAADEERSEATFEGLPGDSPKPLTDQILERFLELADTTGAVSPRVAAALRELVSSGASITRDRLFAAVTGALERGDTDSGGVPDQSATEERAR